MMIRRVEGHSMLPTYQPGTIVFGWRFVRPKVGSVVVALVGGREIIKRVTAVREGRYFLAGDNKTASNDSRHYGWLGADVIRSVVIGSIKR